jgi:osmotically-inducible protein OsmY
VDVEAGQVTLRGSVDTLTQKRIAAGDANDVSGVGWVTNLLDVKTKPRSDLSILNEVLSDIGSDYALDGKSIATSVTDGIVTLNGDVNTFWEKSHAGDVASRVHGVRQLINKLRVNNVSPLSDATLKSEIKDRLTTNAETMFIAPDLKVDVDHGKVTLTGVVNYWSEYAAAQNIAFQTPGVWAVVNDLAVRDYDYAWGEFTPPWPELYTTTDLYYPDNTYYHWWW